MSRGTDPGRKEENMNEKANCPWSIRCGSHTYITLYWNDKHIFCLDNDMEYMERIIEKIEKRTQMKFNEIPIVGSKEDFNGLRFLHGGFRYNWL